MPLLAISYRRQDTEAITGRIFDRLTLTYGRDAVFRDIDNIPAGTDFREYISSTLGKCDLLIVIIGRRWLGRTRGGRTGRIDEQNDLVRIEVETALRQNLPIIPVLVGNAQMPTADDLPETIKPLSFRNAIRIDAGQDFDNHISRLLRSVNGSIRIEEPNASQRTVKQPIDLAHSEASFFSSRNILLVVAGGVLVLLLALAIPVYLNQQRYQETGPSSTQLTAPTTDGPAEIKTLLSENEVEPLQTYLKNHPTEPRRQEIMDKIEDLKRAEFSEWTVFEVSVKLKKLAYIRFSSLERAGDNKFTILSRVSIDPSLPTYITNIPEGAYQEAQDVFDCKDMNAWQAGIKYVDKSGDVLYHYKWADPKYVADMVKPTTIVAGTLLYTERSIVCNDALRTPSVNKSEIKNLSFQSLSSTSLGDGETYYKPLDGGREDKEALFVIRFNEDKKIGDNQNEIGKAAFGDMTYTTVVIRDMIKCSERKITAIKSEFYNAEGELKYLAGTDSAKGFVWSDINQNSPLGLLRRTACGD